MPPQIESATSRSCTNPMLDERAVSLPWRIAVAGAGTIGPDIGYWALKPAYRNPELMDWPGGGAGNRLPGLRRLRGSGEGGHRGLHGMARGGFFQNRLRRRRAIITAGDL